MNNRSLLSLGPIFPLRGKIPLTKHGCKDASSDLSIIENWEKSYSTSNWGLLTGAISGFFVLDSDLKHCGPESLLELEAKHGKLPTTLTCKTGGGGFHYFFKYPSNKVIKNRNAFVRGLDIRGDGGYVVGAGSTHPETGKEYEWVDASTPIAEAPEWLLDLICSERAATQEVEIVQECATIPDGQRNSCLYSLASKLFRLGLSSDAVYAALLEENASKCSPPLDEKEIETIHRSASKNLIQQTSPPIPTEKVFYGLGGELVKTVMPFTEADPMAILSQFFVTMGAVVGRTFSYRIGGTDMYPNEFCLIVGSSSKARKGTSLGIVEYVLKKRFPDFFKNNAISGLSSGEGLINRVKDTTSTTSLRKEVSNAF